MEALNLICDLRSMLSMGFDPRSYFWNRFARIYPIYFLAAAMALPWLVKDLAIESSTSSWLFALAAGVILIIWGGFLIQAWLPQSFAFWNNSASWSISVEAFFYSLFPFLSGILRNVSLQPLLLLFAAMCILSSMAPVSATVFSNAPQDFAFFYAMPIFRLPEFVAGIIAYRLMRRVEWRSRTRNLLLFIVFLGLLHVILLGPLLPGYTLHNWIFIPAVTSALVLLYKSELGGGQWLLGNFAFVWLGQISYCFYSFQFHVLEGLRYMLPLEKIGVVGFAMFATFLLLAVSALAHHLVEEPARVWIRTRTIQSSKVGGIKK
ncbi:acyltransferase family protein [bacterium]|nr:acyltransferase family protein [bacterium]